MRTFISRLFHSKMSSLLIITLVTLACSIPAFCGEIHDAAETGDLAKVKALLKENPALISSKDNFGKTPLHIAVEYVPMKEGNSCGHFPELPRFKGLAGILP
jgi:hypothetical protein